MKKIILSAICLITLIGSVSAQQHRRYYPRRRPTQSGYQKPRDDFNAVKFGVAGGLNIANIINTNDSYFNTNTKAGLNAGVTLDVPIHYPFSFEPELLYSGKGFNAYTSDNQQFSQRTNYLDLPLLLKVKLVPGFNLVVGPSINFLLSTQNTFTNGFSSITQDAYIKDSNGYTKTVVAGVLGVSFDISPNVEIRGRYNLDLQKTNIDGVSNIPQYNNQVWQIGVGLKFF
jgi:opacity protein-like surface antigen